MIVNQHTKPKYYSRTKKREEVRNFISTYMATKVSAPDHIAGLLEEGVSALMKLAKHWDVDVAPGKHYDLRQLWDAWEAAWCNAGNVKLKEDSQSLNAIQIVMSAYGKACGFCRISTPYRRSTDADVSSVSRHY